MNPNKTQVMPFEKTKVTSSHIYINKHFRLKRYTDEIWLSCVKFLHIRPSSIPTHLSFEEQSGWHSLCWKMRVERSFKQLVKQNNASFELLFLPFNIFWAISKVNVWSQHDNEKEIINITKKLCFLW